jgi:hypothetical protein
VSERLRVQLHQEALDAMGAYSEHLCNQILFDTKPDYAFVTKAYVALNNYFLGRRMREYRSVEASPYSCAWGKIEFHRDGYKADYLMNTLAFWDHQTLEIAARVA